MSDEELTPYDLTAEPKTYVLLTPGWDEKLKSLTPRNPPDLVTWLRRCIEQRRYLALHAIELGSAAEWVELSSGVLMTCRADAPQDNRDGVHPLGDSSLTRLMEANDPRDTIARCEAELAILGEYEAARLVADAAREQRGGVGGAVYGLVRGLERVVRLLACGYGHRDGYRQEWAP